MCLGSVGVVVQLCVSVQEYQVGNKNVVISDTNMKQVVYVYKCVDCTVQIKGKVNNVNVGKRLSWCLLMG